MTSGYASRPAPPHFCRWEGPETPTAPGRGDPGPERDGIPVGGGLRRCRS
ncbi:hypothetical protein [Ornithinimicrobium kibberense]